MSWGIKIAAKTQAAAKAAIAKHTQQPGESHGIPPLVAESISAGLERFGEPGAGQAFLIEGSGHSVGGPSDYNDKAQHEITKIPLAE